MVLVAFRTSKAMTLVVDATPKSASLSVVVEPSEITAVCPEPDVSDEL